MKNFIKNLSAEDRRFFSILFPVVIVGIAIIVAVFIIGDLTPDNPYITGRNR